MIICLPINGQIKKTGVFLKELQILSEHVDKIFVIAFSSSKKNKYKLHRNIFCVNIPIIRKDKWFNLPLIYLKYFNCLLDLCIKEKIDIIKAQEPIISGLPSIIVGKALGIPVIIKVGGFSLDIISNKITQYSHIFKKLILITSKLIYYFVLKNANYVFTIGPKITRHIKNMGIINTKEIGVIIELDKTDIKKQHKIKNFERVKIIYIGRLTREKGVYNVLNIAEKFKKTNSKFIVLGEGPEKNSLDHMIKKRNLEGTINMIGAVPHTEIPIWLNRADIFLLPSFTEGTPVALLEAMFIGVPSVASNVGDIPQLFENGRHLLLSKPGDIDTYVKNIEKLINDNKMYERISRNAQSYVLENFDNKKCVLRQVDIFHKFKKRLS
jgi:glycosyltransferase involved in cell wall biosynthesis